MKKTVLFLSGLLLPAALLAGVPEILSRLTHEEKAALIVGSRSTAFDGIGYTQLYVPGAAGTTHPVDRLGIPAIVLSDGPAGVRIKDRSCTKFPIGSCLSSTWNPEVVRQVGAAIGEEAREYGVDVLLAPGANIQRNPLCGRNFEYYSEDPLLSGKMAAAYIEGVQSRGVGASLKHFAVNNQELNRLFLDARVSRRALREIYLKNFEIAVKEGRPWTVMTSYNYINGTYAAENGDLVNGLLRGEWGFEGAVMTDWGGGHDTGAIVSCGNDMIQPGSDVHYEALVAGIRDGSISGAAVDSALTHILGLIERVSRSRSEVPSGKTSLEEHAGISRRAAREGMVLLKNCRSALPLPAGKAVALLGTSSYDFITGGTGSGDVYGSYSVNLKEGLERQGYILDAAVDSFYCDYMAYERARCAAVDGADKKWFVDAERAIETVPRDVIKHAAETADAAVVTIGRVFGEGKDRSLVHSFLLSDAERDLVRTTSEAFHARGKKVVVILNVGGIIEMASWRDLADAILVSWLPGCEGGNAIADVLSGAENPSGRLPMSIPVHYTDDPTAGSIPDILADKPFNYSYYRRNLGPGFRKRYEIPNVDYVNYREGIFVGYRHYLTRRIRTAYPFGFGLSYTTFKYSGFKVIPEGDGYRVSVTVHNTGTVAGREVVQIYVKAPGREMEKPQRELKAFAKTSLLAPGDSETIETLIPRSDLASYDEGRSGWSVEKGRYVFFAARNCTEPLCRNVIRVRSSSFSPTPDHFAADPVFIP